MKLTRQQVRELRAAPVGESGNRIRAAVALSRGSLTELARLSGLSFTYVADTARGRWRDTSVRRAHRFARVFGCLVDDLFPDTEDE